MSFKQKVLRFFYPVIRKLGKSGKNGTILINNNNVKPIVSLYDEELVFSNGKTIRFSDYSDKKIVLVNTASDCGYTGQYGELQTLYERLGDRIVIIAFPANDFAEQEKASDKDISQFCQLNYGVSFPIAKKGVVKKGEHQQPVFKWLTDSNVNGWNDHAPDWNFSKYIVDRDGKLTHYFGPSISPLDDEFIEAVT